MIEKQMNFSLSNLSKIKPKLRTQGNVTGNFGRPKTKAGSPISGLGVTKAKVVNVVKPDDYIKRLYDAFDKTEDPKLREFIYVEIKKYMIQRGQWKA
jgi:hypothetical protein